MSKIGGAGVPPPPPPPAPCSSYAPEYYSIASFFQANCAIKTARQANGKIGKMVFARQYSVLVNVSINSG